MSNVCLDIQSTVDIKKTMFSQAMCLKVSRVKECFFVVLKLPYLKKKLCSSRESVLSHPWEGHRPHRRNACT